MQDDQETRNQESQRASDVLVGKRLLTISEFTFAYGPCRTRVYELFNSGALVGVKVGRTTKIPIESAENWKNTLPVYQPSGTSATSDNLSQGKNNVPSVHTHIAIPFQKAAKAD